MIEGLFFSTHRLPIAAYLMTRGMALDHTQLIGKIVHFYFKEPAACDLLQTEFLGGNPAEKLFWQKTEDLRSLVIALLPRHKGY